MSAANYMADDVLTDLKSYSPDQSGLMPFTGRRWRLLRVGRSFVPSFEYMLPSSLKLSSFDTVYEHDGRNTIRSSIATIVSTSRLFCEWAQAANSEVGRLEDDVNRKLET
ncbi:hypothetical protein BHYA_0075g00230 [Botrytis hyacinthi]|uniref:Uncharacterized protein n=1 Tax=Botrytis hyacinthi TaxID=278943 RepID=A0A4Z1GT96_9HELO|nr:hypothetical protein BHYA_0075g00230 [Botrytis hyacinthi]